MPSKAPSYWSEACTSLSNADPVLNQLIAAAEGAILQSRSDPFVSLCRSIIAQQISVVAAEAVWQRLLTHVIDMTPRNVLSETEESLRSCGLSGSKARYLRGLAERFIDGSLDPGTWHQSDDDTVIEQLVRVKGIGRWTAEMFLIFHLLRPDVLPVADIGIQRAIANLFCDGTRPSEEEMVQIAEPWRPWRTVASWHLWRSLDVIPVEY